MVSVVKTIQFFLFVFVLYFLALVSLFFLILSLRLVVVLKRKVNKIIINAQSNHGRASARIKTVRDDARSSFRFVDAFRRFVFCLVALVSLFLLLFREKFSRILSLSAAPSIVVLCVVSRRARAHRQKKKKDADNTPLVVSLFKSTDTWIKN